MIIVSSIQSSTEQTHKYGRHVNKQFQYSKYGARKQYIDIFRGGREDSITDVVVNVI
jgi:hypothetical protein